MPSTCQTALTQTTTGQFNSDSALTLAEETKSLLSDLKSKKIEPNIYYNKKDNLKTIAIFHELNIFCVTIPTVLDYKIISKKINNCIDNNSQNVHSHLEYLFILPGKTISIIQIKKPANESKFNLTTYYDSNGSKEIKKILADDAKGNKNLNKYRSKKIESLDFEFIQKLINDYLIDCLSPNNRVDTLHLLLSTLIFKLKSSFKSEENNKISIIRINQEKNNEVFTDSLPCKKQDRVQDQNIEKSLQSISNRNQLNSIKLQANKENAIQFTLINTLAIFDPLKNLNNLERIVAHFLNQKTQTEIKKVLLPLLIEKNIAVIEVTLSEKNLTLIAYISNPLLKKRLETDNFPFKFKNFSSVRYQESKISFQYKAYLLLKKKIESHLWLTLSDPTNKPTDNVSESSAILDEISFNLDLNNEQTTQELPKSISRCDGDSILIYDYILNIKKCQYLISMNPPKKSKGFLGKISSLFVSNESSINSASKNLTTEVPDPLNRSTLKYN
jgi:hypothetical protein